VTQPLKYHNLKNYFRQQKTSQAVVSQAGIGSSAFQLHSVLYTLQ
jgi:hypothetical protein